MIVNSGGEKERPYRPGGVGLGDGTLLRQPQVKRLSEVHLATRPTLCGAGSEGRRRRRHGRWGASKLILVAEGIICYPLA